MAGDALAAMEALDGAGRQPDIELAAHFDAACLTSYLLADGEAPTRSPGENALRDRAGAGRRAGRGLPAAWQTARAFARLICPASSMTRTSTAPAISSRAHSHAVPAARFASPASAFGHLRVGAGLDDALVQTAVAGVRLLDPAGLRPANRRPPRTRRRAGWRSPCGCWRSPRPASRRRADRGSSARRCRSCRCPAALHGKRAVEPRGDPLDGGQRGLALQGEAFPLRRSLTRSLEKPESRCAAGRGRAGRTPSVAGCPPRGRRTRPLPRAGRGSPATPCSGRCRAAPAPPGAARASCVRASARSCRRSRPARPPSRRTPRLSSSDSAVSGFFGKFPTSISCGCSGKR